MPIDPNIALGVHQVQIENPLAQYAQLTQLQNAQNQNRLADLMYSEKQRELSGENALASLLSSGGKDADVIQGLASQGYGKQALAYQKQLLDQQKAKADIGHITAQTGKLNSETEGLNYDLSDKKRTKAIVDIAALSDPKQAHASLDAHVAAGDLTPQMADMVRNTIPTDPAQFPQWQIGMLKRIMGAKEAAGYTAPDANTVANNKTSVLTTQMTNATSRANNRDNIQKDFVINGINPDGTPGGDIDRTAQAIASGQLPPPSGMALTNPRNQRILARVMEINPDYDYTTVTAKKKAASDFATGQLGNALRSVSTANAHLDQLGELADAMNNGDSQIINRVKNAYQTATGNPAPTNFDAIKNIVGQEVVKAIVAGGGSAGERDEAAKTFANASSPAQLKGAMQHYRMVMQAQQQNLLEQRRAAGLPDSTLPNYKNGNAGVPPDIQKILNKHGG